MNRDLYSELQLKILDGEIPFEEIMAANYTRIIKIAEANDEKDVVELVRPLLDEKKRRFREKRRAESRQYYADHCEVYRERNKARYMAQYEGDDGLYTKRQIAIIRGELPFKDVTMFDYHNIRERAEAVGNSLLVEFIDSLIVAKTLENKNKINAYARKHYLRKRFREAEDKETIFSAREMKILNGEVSGLELGMRQLERLRIKTELVGNPQYIDTVASLIEQKNG